MKVKNQIVVISGILVLLASTIGASYNVQPAKAAFGKDVVTTFATTQQQGSFGLTIVSPAAQAGTQGTAVQAAAHANEGPPNNHNPP